MEFRNLRQVRLAGKDNGFAGSNFTSLRKQARRIATLKVRDGGLLVDDAAAFFYRSSQTADQAGRMKTGIFFRVERAPNRRNANTILRLGGAQNFIVLLQAE